MSISTTITALQTVHAAISGVKTAPTAFPSVLNTATLPIVLIWPAQGDWNLQAIDLDRCKRRYTVRCFVKPVAQGEAGIDDGYQECVTLLNAFGLAYLDDLTLGSTVDHIRLIQDTGVSNLRWADVAYWGFEYTLEVVEKTS